MHLLTHLQAHMHVFLSVSLPFIDAQTPPPPSSYSHSKGHQVLLLWEPPREIKMKYFSLHGGSLL